MKLIGLLPKSVALWLVPKLYAPGALDPAQVNGLKVETLVAERLADYSAVSGRFPAVTIGTAMGGTSAHLALALRGPFLPQAFVLTLKGGSKNGDVRRYYERSADLARSIAETNPEVMTIQHFDPVHDGWLTRNVNHLRIKLLDLPQAYKEFLRERLEPGGEVCYLEGGARWARFRVGPRSVFQVGGWGDIPAQEFLDGSPRLAEFARREGLTSLRWRLDGFSLEEGPESEWGAEPGLGDALETFCREEGYRFRRIHFEDPNDYSRLAFRAVRRQIEKSGNQPAGTLVEMFSQFDPAAALRSSLIPLWLFYNTKDSLRFLQEMRAEIPAGQPVFFSPLATFSITPDLTPWQEWKEALEGFKWVNVGARESHYPADTATLADWQSPLRGWAAAHPCPVTARLALDELCALADGIAAERLAAAASDPANREQGT
ncbi:MAG TPA: hypothetical protein VFF68_12760 [Anaerolineaceae bacterium]|nr:hypothetical protein [Anaerolineaceae bacterium]